MYVYVHTHTHTPAHRELCLPVIDACVVSSLAVMNNAITNIHMHIFVWAYVLNSLGYTSRNRIAEIMVSSCLTFKEDF
jgi:hypothetical protein